MRHSNISIFVPHLGCDNNCSFCNQKHITGQAFIPTAEDVVKSVEIALSSPKFDGTNAEIAFFGGSFTAIDYDYMVSLLSAAKPYVFSGKVKGIRVSTRPDKIDCKILSVLKEFGVSAIELGAQSMDNRVLSANNRGHFAEDVVNASKLIRDFGFELGLQMMTGLYLSDENTDILTAEEIASLCPDTVRIYPTIVLKNTTLSNLFADKKYIPQSLDEAIRLCAKLKLFFYNKNINVIRLGLHSIDNNAYVAGPWHPAFSELCDTEIYREIINTNINHIGNFLVSVGRTELSKAIGQKRSNITYFSDKKIDISFKVDDSVGRYQVKIEEVKTKCF